MQIAVGEGWDVGDLLFPGACEGCLVGFLPIRLGHRRERDRGALHRPQQPHPPFDLAVVEHQAGCRDLHGGTPGFGVDQKHRTGLRARSSASASVKGWLRSRRRMVKICVSARPADGVERPPVADDQAFRRERLDAVS